MELLFHFCWMFYLRFYFFAGLINPKFGWLNFVFLCLKNLFYLQSVPRFNTQVSSYISQFPLCQVCSFFIFCDCWSWRDIRFSTCWSSKFGWVLLFYQYLLFINKPQKLCCPLLVRDIGFKKLFNLLFCLTLCSKLIFDLFLLWIVFCHKKRLGDRTVF